MENTDAIYAKVIFDLFGIKLESKEEIDDFFDSIEETLSLEQIEILQLKIDEAFHDTCTEFDQGNGCKTDRQSVISSFERLPSITDIVVFDGTSFTCSF